MTELQKRFREDLALRGFTVKTQGSYVGSVRQLAKHYGRSPDLISDQEVRQWFLHVIEVEPRAPKTIRIYKAALKHFYTLTLGREMPVLDIVTPPDVHKEQAVFSVGEVQKFLALVRREDVRTAFLMMYSCGMRPAEPLGLVASDIDRSTMVVLVRDGKGRKDRKIPLPLRTLESLEAYWRSHRNRSLLFPNKRGDGPMALGTLQRVFKEVLHESGINQPRAVPRTLRHSYATHLVDAGIPINVVKMVMGHNSLNTTAKYYVHLTPKMLAGLSAAVNKLTAKL